MRVTGISKYPTLLVVTPDISQIWKLAATFASWMMIDSPGSSVVRNTSMSMLSESRVLTFICVALICVELSQIR